MELVTCYKTVLGITVTVDINNINVLELKLQLKRCCE